MGTKGRGYAGLISLALGLGAFALAYAFVGIDAIKQAVEAAGIAAPLIFILLKASTIVVVPLAGSPLYPFAGLVFGFWPGVIYSLVGDFIGFTISFWLARKLGYPAIRSLVDTQKDSLFSRIIAQVATVRGLFYTYITFFGMPELISYAAGLSRIPYLTFIVILFPLSAVGSVLLVLIGSSLDSSTSSIFLAAPIVIGSVCFILGAYLFSRVIRIRP